MVISFLREELERVIMYELDDMIVGIGMNKGVSDFCTVVVSGQKECFEMVWTCTKSV